MEPARPAALVSAFDSSRDAIDQLTRLFGSYKAEWLRDSIYDFFTEPSYFPELTTPRPCILEGGRGTGKTTVLRCLSYQGQFALRNRAALDFAAWEYFGFYLRLNTNRVTAFQGPELTESEWQRYFAHYINVELCSLALEFLVWCADKDPDAARLSAGECKQVAIALNLSAHETEQELLAALSQARREFEAAINNAGDPERRSRVLTMQGAPVDTLLAAIRRLPQFVDKEFFFLLDEYENLLPYQQRIVNTLIKHSGDLYTFKVGVKELGLRVRSTLNPDERLVSPADYVLLTISEKLGPRFAEFAAAVCNERLHHVDAGMAHRVEDVRELLPSLSEDDEASVLGVREVVAETTQRLSENVTDSSLLGYYAGLPPLFAYFIAYWAKVQDEPLRESIRSAMANPDEWNTRYGNYRHAILFTIRRGKRGIHKYYCGWDTYVHLAAGNIRYLLELVEQSLVGNIRAGADFGTPMSPETQTVAVQAVGRKNVKELDGLSVHGAKLTKLLLGLGRVFQVMALHPEGHIPEANQFSLEPGPGLSDERQGLVEMLIREGIMHLVLVRFSGNKLQDPGDTRAYDYMVHPMFCGFFEFSYRRKRKISLSGDDIIGFVETPRKTIKDVLRAQNRSDDVSLPEQLRLFGDYYARN